MLPSFSMEIAAVDHIAELVERFAIAFDCGADVRVHGVSLHRATEVDYEGQTGCEAVVVIPRVGSTEVSSRALDAEMRVIK